MFHLFIFQSSNDTYYDLQNANTKYLTKDSVICLHKFIRLLLMDSKIG